MVHIPESTFVMGLAEGQEHERPPHPVRVSAYCLDATEVTVQQYRACVTRGACAALTGSVQWPGAAATERAFYGRFCTGAPGTESHPVNCIDWGSARGFCAWRGARLPTEAEWELAARGADGRRYPWGNELPSAVTVNACGPECVAGMRSAGVSRPAYGAEDGHPGTAPVGSFPLGASPAGVQDMAGNVWEWTADWFAPYGPSGQTNPSGAPTGTSRAYRGGAWATSDPAGLRVTNRQGMAPDERTATVGFRCAASPRP